ncbi:MAG: SPFH domain-containing protein [Phycisphaerales bacterium]
MTPPEGPGRGPGRGAGSKRDASVNLRTPGGGDEMPGLDPANQSLADALRLVFVLLQFSMLVLFALFAFSGFQTVRETESGVRLLFGRVTGERLDPGPHLSFPYPMGELIRVDTGLVALEVDEAFWPAITEDQKRLTLQQVIQQNNKLSLKPGEDGSLITGDEAIAHAKWRVQYVRRDPRKFVQNVLPEAELDIVRAAVERGVVQAVAQIPLDDLLKQSPGETGSVASRARAIAQQSLDRIDSGISIEGLTLLDRTPPFFVYADFSGVQSAQQKASQRLTDAESTARNTLNAMAGDASIPLIAQIDRYETALATNDAAAQTQAMDAIQALFEGRPTSTSGEPLATGASGTVTAITNEARQYRSSVVSQRRAELDSFHAKLAQFKSNPGLVIQREWADAMAEFLSRDIVEVFALPPGRADDITELWLNRDPAWVKAVESARKERELKRSENQRRLEQEQERFKTRTGDVELKDR